MSRTKLITRTAQLVIAGSLLAGGLAACTHRTSPSTGSGNDVTGFTTAVTGGGSAGGSTGTSTMGNGRTTTPKPPHPTGSPSPTQTAGTKKAVLRLSADVLSGNGAGTIRVYNDGNAPLTWQVSGLPTGMSVSASSGSVASGDHQILTVAVHAGNGEYLAQVPFSSNGGNATVTVSGTLTVPPSISDVTVADRTICAYRSDAAIRVQAHIANLGPNGQVNLHWMWTSAHGDLSAGPGSWTMKRYAGSNNDAIWGIVQNKYEAPGRMTVWVEAIDGNGHSTESDRSNIGFVDYC